ncbi:hypothetical protein CROQUDRAFT_130018 [Cronartium quercuum f. sp. fusiforme G11]|uniref:Uncharacterized protein n=1 Tax=Cronartium quercuum f. sp. fusiforme G11 TaxID=708437 RepID=A0A9P6TGN8_9BASI|nr:hypothetical protein CROQUDRAFT_130018 [Cronartium quercuum f. sp. fusiforme G11]
MSPSEEVPLLGAIHAGGESSSLATVPAGSSLATVPAYGWMNFEDTLNYLNQHSALKSYDESEVVRGLSSKYTQEENMVRWALSHVDENHVNRQIGIYGTQHDEIFNAMLWLIGHAEGNWEALKRVAAGWKDVRPPEGRVRMAYFDSNAVTTYKWLTKAREAQWIPPPVSDITAIAAYLGRLMSKENKWPPAGVIFKQKATDGPPNFTGWVQGFTKKFGFS